MRLPLLIVTILFFAGIATDTYIYYALKRYRLGKIPFIVHYSVSAICAILLISIMFMPVRTGSDTMLRAVMWMLYTYLSVYTSKLIFVFFDALSLVPVKLGKKQYRPLSIAGAVLGCLWFIAMWWGALFNRFNIDVERVDVKIEDLPPAFDGFTIAQISDLHVGTYGNDTTFISELVDEINGLHPDMIVFTGDIVNRKANELTPFSTVLSRLKAPYGVYAILGNHDYGDYVDWPEEQMKKDNLDSLLSQIKSMGWKMLNNSHELVGIGNDTIAIVGVENVGDPPFHTYGDLAKAYPTPSDKRTKILLSHNPAHWHNDISGNKTNNYALTLSGHTHAMQMEFLSISPATFRYEEWGGLYSDGAGHQIYVNIGTGTVGIPARIGATPEVTLITLRHQH